MLELPVALYPAMLICNNHKIDDLSQGKIHRSEGNPQRNPYKEDKRFQLDKYFLYVNIKGIYWNPLADNGCRVPFFYYFVLLRNPWTPEGSALYRG